LGSEAKPEAKARTVVVGPIVVGVTVVAIVRSVIRSVIAIPSVIVGTVIAVPSIMVGTIAVAIPTVPIPDFLHLASRLALLHRHNLRLRGSGLRHSDH
jgi:hypothetical protein